MSSAKRVRLDCIFYILMVLGLIALLIWSTKGEIARNPLREAIADLGPYGLVTVRLQTNPYPVKPTGTVGLSFMLMADAKFPAVGTWWLQVNLAEGGY